MTVHIYHKTSAELHHRFTDLLRSLSVLSDLSQITLDKTDEKQLLHMALSALLRNQDIARASVYVFQNDVLRNTAGLDWDDLYENVPNLPSQELHAFYPGEGIVGHSYISSRQINCSDCRHDERFIHLDYQSEDHIPGSLLCTPIQHAETTIGVLCCSHPDTDFFNVWHEHLLNVVSNILAQLLINNKLFQHMEKEVASRTQELETTLYEMKQLKQKYQQLSFIDDLTSLHNRRYFFLEMENAFSEANRYKQPLCIILLDIDYFKGVNDRYGHPIGDEVLRRVAHGIQKEAGPEDIVARIGGEEFAIGLKCPESDSRALAERVRLSISRIDMSDIMESGITISLGGAGIDDINGLLDDLMQQADTALYHSKSYGRDQVNFAKDLLEGF